MNNPRRKQIADIIERMSELQALAESLKEEIEQVRDEEQ